MKKFSKIQKILIILFILYPFNCFADYNWKKLGSSTEGVVFYVELSTIKKVGNNVYKDIKDHIKKGNIKMLAKHWQHFFDRENADYNISINDEEIILTVNRCTAYEHVRKLVGNVSPNFCDQTIKTNEALAEDTPYEIKTEILGEAACRQTIRKRA